MAGLSCPSKADLIPQPLLSLKRCLRRHLKVFPSLCLIFSGLEYISSAGLRVILKAQKVMYSQGSMKLIGVSDEGKEIFEITGFDNFLKIE